MNLDKLAAVSRAVDAVICWTLAPKWCRGKLSTHVKRAYRRTDTDGQDYTYPKGSEYALQ